MTLRTVPYLLVYGLLAGLAAAVAGPGSDGQALLQGHLEISAARDRGAERIKNRTVHLVSFRSCSQDKTKNCNVKYFKELKHLSDLVSKIPAIQRHHLFQGYPPEVALDLRWVRHRAEGVRGRGYWFWKSAILNLLIKNRTLQEGDVVVWADGDTQNYFTGLTKTQPAEHWELFLKMNTLDLLVSSQRFCEAEWTKMDIFNRFNVSWHDERYGFSPQAHAEFFVFFVNKRTRRFLHLWEKLMQNYDLVSDSKSVSPDAPPFRQNRHDQSIMSLMVKANTPVVPDDLGDCKPWVDLFKKKYSLGQGLWDHRLHPEFGIENLTARIADFKTVVAEHIHEAQKVGALLQTQGEEPARRGVQRRICVRGSCHDLDRLQDDVPAGVA